MRNVVVLINGRAGPPNPDSPVTQQQLADIFRRSAIDADLILVDGSGIAAAAEEAVKRAAAGHIDSVIAGGGDGTVRCVAAALAGTQIPMGVLPMGTLNHFAKDLGIPLELERAVEVIAAGNVRRIDAAEVNGRIFINNSSIGAYPYIVLERERRQRRSRLPKWLAMVLACLRVLWRFPRARLSVMIEGAELPCRSPCVFVGNNEYTFTLPRIGGRLRLDEGLLSLIVISLRSRWALLWLGVRLAFGLHVKSHEVMHRRAKAAVILSRARRLQVSLDGEVEMIRSPLTYRTRPGALIVFAPTELNSARAAIGPAEERPPLTRTR